MVLFHDICGPSLVSGTIKYLLPYLRISGKCQHARDIYYSFSQLPSSEKTTARNVDKSSTEWIPSLVPNQLAFCAYLKISLKLYEYENSTEPSS